MVERIAPWSTFNYLVTFMLDGSSNVVAGFQNVSGLPPVSLHDRFPRMPKVNGIGKAADVTLKRGVANSLGLANWIDAVRNGAAAASYPVLVTLRGESNQPVAAWTLRSAAPVKYTGPALSNLGMADVAIEELVLSAENIELTYAN